MSIQKGFARKVRRRSFIANNAGVVAPIVALLFPVLFGMAGVGVDVSSWLMTKRNLQTAADAAALAGAWEIANGITDEDSVQEAAMKEAENNGYVPDGANTITVSIGEDENGNQQVTADISQEVSVWFSSIFMDTAVMAGTEAVAAVGDTAGSTCILSLDGSVKNAMTSSGSVVLDMPDCGIAVNSDNDQALYFNGSVDVTVKTAKVVGGYEEVGASVDFNYESLRTGTSPTADPYEDLDVPSYTACTSAQKKKGPTKVTTSKTLNPGVYCGGLSISGTVNITFNPGVYTMDGGDFTVTGGGSMTGSGVSFVMTNSASGGSYGDVKISGSKKISFSAPADGQTMEGVVFYQDRHAPASSSHVNTLIGTADIKLDGTAYFPAREFEIGGNAASASNLTSPCSRIIAKTVTLHGNPRLGNNCDGSAALSIGSPSVTLVQ